MRYGVLGAGAVAVTATGVVAWRYAAAPSAEQQFAMLDRYCAECHNPAELAGGLSLEQLDHSDIHAQAEIWEKVVRKLRGGLMPPPGGPRPEAQQIHQFVAFMEARIDAGAVGAPSLGSVPLHRLNRKEYANAVRDLLALEIDAATLLPQDDKSGGFDNIADALQVSPSFIEQYVTAARTIADRALGDAAPHPKARRTRTRFPASASARRSAADGRITSTACRSARATDSS